MGKKVIITGATGMVGKGVLLECLNYSEIDEVLSIGRRSLEMSHPKLRELIVKDFTTLNGDEADFAQYDACFYCMGVSAMGMSEEEYDRITYQMAKAFIDACFEANPQMTFIYVSGTGTDSSEKGSMMWARVKGKTENYLLGKGFAKAHAFRPGFIIPENGIKSSTPLYNFFYVITRPFFPLMKKSKSITTTTKVGRAMIHSLLFDVDSQHLENPEINEAAARVG